MCSGGRCDHHGGQANPTAAEDCHPLPRLDLADLAHATIGRCHPAAQGRGRDEAQGVWQAHEILIGPRDSYQLGERSPIGEARLLLPQTGLLIAGAAFRA
jgi:hypothetical protein